jgi:hypothetical protein
MISFTTGSKQVGGFSLVEVLVALGIGSFVLTGVLATNREIVRSGLRVANYAEMEEQCRRGLDQLGGDLRSATAFTYNSASDITLTIPATGGSGTQVTWAWDSTSLSLYRVPGASSSSSTGRIVFVRGIPAGSGGTAGLSFSRYDRDGNAASSDPVTKRIVVAFSVQRTGTTLVTTSQNAITATFVMRNL